MALELDFFLMGLLELSKAWEFLIPVEPPAWCPFGFLLIKEN